MQNFINDDAQNVPKMRLDLKQLGNVTSWLLRNLHFKNKDIPKKYLIALTKLSDKLTKNLKLSFTHSREWVNDLYDEFSPKFIRPLTRRE